jgi:hypothetical protein
MISSPTHKPVNSAHSIFLPTVVFGKYCHSRPLLPIYILRSQSSISSGDNKNNMKRCLAIETVRRNTPAKVTETIAGCQTGMIEQNESSCSSWRKTDENK